jgi:hypothetical protein
VIKYRREAAEAGKTVSPPGQFRAALMQLSYSSFIRAEPSD